MKNRAVLDASAGLTLLLDEPGAGAVAAVLPEALLSAVNLAEVASKVLDGECPKGRCRRSSTL